MERSVTSRKRARTAFLMQAVMAKLALGRYLCSKEGYQSFRGSGVRLRIANKLIGHTMYDRRRLIMLGLAHAMATMVVWAHFFYTKYRKQEASVPDGANLYWWKRLVPPLEFGAMHAILFQMALLPLTMARSTVAYLSQTYVGRKYIPLHKVVAMHIHLGYVMVGFVFGSTILFFIFFGQGCVQQKSGKEPSPNGVKTFCKKMQSEIMITGLTIMGCLLLVAVTSYLRNRIKYEIFYIIHHFVFIMFALAIAHTLDDAFRRGQVRSQNFKWFSASLVWYFTDRMHALMNGRDCRTVEATALGSGESESRKVVRLSIERPKMFIFQPGQYVFIAIKSIDVHWHPYSIASAPLDDTIDFLIEVMATSKVDGTDSWTHKLWRMIKAGDKPIVSIVGPYGTGFNDAKNQNEIVAIGSGTGIVPMLSLAKAHTRQLLKMNVAQQVKALHEKDEAQREFAENYFRESKSIMDILRSFVWKSKADRSEYRDAWDNHRCFRDIVLRRQYAFRLAQLKKEGRNPTKKFYAAQYRKNANHEINDLLQLFFPLMDLTAIALLISFSVNSGIITQAMREVPLWIFLGCHIYFFLHWVYSTINTSIWYADLLIIIVSTISFVAMHDVIVDENKDWAILTRWGFCALAAYRLFRLASDILLEGTPELRACMSYVRKTGEVADSIEKFTLVFITPQADFCRALWGELNDMYMQLSKYQVDNKFVEIRVYCTSKDEVENKLLLSEVGATPLAQSGALRMHRPNFDDMITEPLYRRVMKDEFAGQLRPSFTSSLIAFCGSTQLGNRIGKAAVACNARIKCFSKNHTIMFYQENYGQATPVKARGGTNLKVVTTQK
jgi:predicted ferric reductase